MHLLLLRPLPFLNSASDLEAESQESEAEVKVGEERVLSAYSGLITNLTRHPTIHRKTYMTSLREFQTPFQYSQSKTRTQWQSQTQARTRAQTHMDTDTDTPMRPTEIQM